MIKKSVSFKWFAVVVTGLITAWAFSGVSDTDLHSKVVRLEGNGHSCSGEQVQAPSGESYILTAAHCGVLAIEGSVKVVQENGQTLMRKVVAEDPASDLLLLEGLPGVKGLKIAKHAYQDQHVRTFTHGHAMKTYQTEGRLVQEKQIQILAAILEEGKSCPVGSKFKEVVGQTFFGEAHACILDVAETVTTAFILPGSSGGAVVDDSGRIVGVVSAGDEKLGYLVRLSDIQAFLAGY